LNIFITIDILTLNMPFSTPLRLISLFAAVKVAISEIFRFVLFGGTYGENQ